MVTLHAVHAARAHLVTLHAVHAAHAHLVILHAVHAAHAQVESVKITVTVRARVLLFDFDGRSGGGGRRGLTPTSALLPARRLLCPSLDANRCMCYVHTWDARA